MKKSKLYILASIAVLASVDFFAMPIPAANAITAYTCTGQRDWKAFLRGKCFRHGQNHRTCCGNDITHPSGRLRCITCNPTRRAVAATADTQIEATEDFKFEIDDLFIDSLGISEDSK